jgi:1,4-dihydroxy-2-naphthoyl-CoA synthase
MSIKTIEENYIGMDKGVAKKINKGAEKLVFDILQSTQYSTPIPSTVRELVTNACDAQREKEMAIEILTGAKQVSDYYITRDGEQYSDSNFDPSYYSISHLDVQRNNVHITYEHNAGIGYCDRLIIRDHGVGIGSNRLEGILELG